eukprot:TRINITY_DN48238_c0_g1_i1.p1 TRINITY_DN48238_c0_g1~~TRINITY_DN48238_c0_g1_i1.p1  ORF type:complete len:388 (-),score=46.67 TRINITY_DN48238_c0_g1_i1:26-1189(-)
MLFLGFQFCLAATGILLSGAFRSSQARLDSHISVITYNVEWKAAEPTAGGVYSSDQKEALQNVAEYIAAEDADFTIIPEATVYLLDFLCPQDVAGTPRSSVTFGHWGASHSSGTSCAYAYDKAGLDGIAILFHPDRFSLSKRSCNPFAQNLSEQSDRTWLEEMNTYDCMHLNAESNFGRGRAMLLASFQPSTSTPSVIIAAVHAGHAQHAKDLASLSTAMTEFCEDLHPDENGPVVIVAGDMNTRIVHGTRRYGIHRTLPELLTLGLPEDDVLSKTWPLNGPKSINEVLGPWRSRFGYGAFFDTASKQHNAARGPQAAYEDIGTYVDKWNKPFNFSALIYKTPFDHILLSLPDGTAPESISTETYVGWVKKPSSDHAPLSMRAWGFR